METIEIWAVLIGLVLIAGVSNRLRNTIVTLPMLYTLFGLGVGLLFRDYLTLSFGDPIVEVIATLTLVLVLGTDASRIKFKPPYRHYVLPLRLLAIGLPLTIAYGRDRGRRLVWGAVWHMGSGRPGRYPGAHGRQPGTKRGQQPARPRPHPPGAKHRKRAE